MFTAIRPATTELHSEASLALAFVANNGKKQTEESPCQGQALITVTTRFLLTVQTYIASGVKKFCEHVQLVPTQIQRACC